MRSLWLLTSLLPFTLIANPQGMKVRSGSASSHAQDASTLVIKTGTQTILDWDQFSINHGETTRFEMPDRHSAVLNRVMGDELSSIDGTLEGNGQVFLINPKGILFGKDAQVNVASFFASTLDLLDGDFLGGERLNFQGETPSSIVNLGTLHAWDGDVILIAYQIDNQGTIHAPSGVAGLAVGTHVIVQPEGEQRIAIRTSSQSGIQNTGAISALQAELKANGNPYQLAISDSGSIDALGVEKRDGGIFLKAEEGSIELTGHYTATKEIHILGRQIVLQDNFTANASTPHGGGTILIGGDYQGKNPDILNAEFLRVGEHVTLYADALESGDGGRVILWGNQANQFFGKVFARGGMSSGNGGFVEVSSPLGLSFCGDVDTTAPCGTSGTLLMDPASIYIQTSPPSTLSCASGTFSTTGTAAYIKTTNLTSCLNANATVIIDATVGSLTTSGPYIELTNNFTWTPSGSNGQLLWLKAQKAVGAQYAGHVNFYALLTANGTGSVRIDTDQFFANGITGNNAGIVTDQGTITINSGSVSLGYIPATHHTIIQSQSGNITISSSSSPNFFDLYGGSGSDSSSQILTQNGGSILIDNFGQMSLHGGSGDNSQARIQTLGNIAGGSITCNLSGFCSLQGGSSNVNGDATISTVSGDLTINSTGSPQIAGISLFGGTAGGTGDNHAEISTGAGTLTLNSPYAPVTLQGGSAANSYTQVLLIASNQSCTITTPSLTVKGGSGDSSYAQIQTKTTLYETPILINSSAMPGTGGVTIQGGSGNNSFAQICTQDIGGDISMYFTGAYTIQGGSSSVVGSASISAGFIGAPASVTLQGGSFSVTGGTNTGTNKAIISAYAGVIDITSISGAVTLAGNSGSSSTASINTISAGSIHIAGQGTGGLSLTGGSGASSSALISTPPGANIILSIQGDYTLTGGSGDSSFAEISGGGNVSLRGGNYTLQGGSSAKPNESKASILATGQGYLIDILARGDILLNNGQAADQHSFIQTTNPLGINPIAIVCNNLTLLGSNSFANSSSVISTISGPIGIAARRDLTLTGGSQAGSVAFIQTINQGNILLSSRNLLVTAGTAASAGVQTSDLPSSNLGRIVVRCRSNCTYNAPTLGVPAFISAPSETLNVQAKGSITLSGYSEFNADSHILLKANYNVSLEDNSIIQITATNPLTSYIDIVVDNSNPAPFNIGLSGFTIDALALLQAGALDISIPIRIFTARQSQNTVDPLASFNGTTFTQGPIYVNTPTEQWGFYYPQAFYGGTGFTFFYKNSNIPPPPPFGPPGRGLSPAEITHTLLRSTFVNCELFYDLDTLLWPVFNDFIHFSLFNVALDPTWKTRELDWTQSKGLSIPEEPERL